MGEGERRRRTGRKKEGGKRDGEREKKTRGKKKDGAGEFSECKIQQISVGKLYPLKFAFLSH